MLFITAQVNIQQKLLISLVKIIMLTKKLECYCKFNVTKIMLTKSHVYLKVIYALLNPYD